MQTKSLLRAVGLPQSRFETLGWCRHYLAPLSRGAVGIADCEGLFPSILLQREMEWIPDNPPVAFSDFAPGVAYQLPIRELIKSLHTLFGSAFLFYILLFPICLAVSVSPVHSKKFALPHLSKGMAAKREGESPVPFLSFGSFCHITKGTALLFLTVKALPFSWM